MQRLGSRAVVLAVLLVPVAVHAQELRLPRRSFTGDAVGTLISPWMAEGTNHNQPVVVGGALLLAGNGEHSLWDISDPTAPARLADFASPHHAGESESHQVTFMRTPEGTVYALMISGRGVDVFDLTDVRAPRLVSALELPGIDYGDNTEAVWGVAWRGDFIYAGGTNTGLHVIDARDPAALTILGRLPTAELGGVDAGPLFLLGDVLVVTTPKERAGVATVSLADPAAPALLDAVVEAEDSYIGGFYGRTTYLLTPLRAYDVLTDPTDIRLVGSTPTPESEYVSFGDGRLFLGGLRPSPGAYVYDVSDPAAPVMEGRIVGRTERFGGTLNDDQFTLPIGNLLVLSDEQIRLGSVIAVIDDRPDERAPEVLWSSPADGETGRPPGTSITLSFSDQIDLRTVSPTTLVVRSAAGDEVRGRLSLTHTLVSFTPEAPLAEGTTYEIVLPAGGIADLGGNGLSAEWRATFSTGAEVRLPRCHVRPGAPVEAGAPATLTADDAGPTATYAWRFGDGTEGAGAMAMHAWTAPGRYAVSLVVTDGGATRSCAATQIVHAPLLPEAPTRSSTVVTTDEDVVVVNPDAGTITAVAKDTLAVRWELPVGERPRTVAAMPDGSLWVAVQGEDRIAVLRDGAVEATIPLGHGAAPFGIAPAGTRALVTLEGDGALVAIDLASRAITSRIELGSAVRGVAVTGTRAYVTRFRSAIDHGEVFQIDLAAMAVERTIPLAIDPGPDEANSGRGVPNYLSSIAISPDGLRAVVPSKKDNVERGPSRDGEPLDDDNTVRTILSAIDLGAGAEVLAERIDLDDHDMASAAAFSPLGDLVFVATQGTNRVDVYETASRRLVSGFATSLAPQGLWLDGGRLYVQSFTERALDVVDVSSLLAGLDAGTRTLESVATVRTEPLSPEALLGLQIFYNADDPRMSADGYLACATCHLDGDSDARVWDFTDRGEGLRNTTDLRGRAGTAHGPVHWSANFDEIQDFEGDIRLRFGGSGLMRDADWETTSDPLGEAKTGLSPALDALAAYVATLDRFPRSPWRNDDGTMTDAAVRGRAVFESLDCLTCHGGERLTDSGVGGLHDVGTIREASGGRLGEPLTGIDTPTLRGVWASAPYFHDGSAATLEATLTMPRHGNAQDLGAAELADLVAFLRELESEELGYPEPVPSTTTGCGCAASGRSVPPVLALAMWMLAMIARARRRA